MCWPTETCNSTSSTECPSTSWIWAFKDWHSITALFSVPPLSHFQFSKKLQVSGIFFSFLIFYYAWLVTHSLQYLQSYLDYLQKTSKYAHIICNISCSVWWIPSLNLYKGLHYLDYLQCGTTYLQYNRIIYDTNNRNSYMITHVVYND